MLVLGHGCFTERFGLLDDINDFLKQTLEEKEKDEPIERKIQNNNIWINTAKDRKEWARLEEKYTMKCVK